MSAVTGSFPGFEGGRFYHRGRGNPAYLCERVRDSKALLHIADVTTIPSHPIRLTVNQRDVSEWTLIDEADEGGSWMTYWRDAQEEYGALDEQSVIFRRGYHLDPYLEVVADDDIKARIGAISQNVLRYDASGHPSIVGGDTGKVWRRKCEELLEHLRTTERTRDVPLREDPERRVKALQLRHDLRDVPDYATYAPWGRLPPLPSRTTEALFKFGKSKYLRPALESGEIRISTASALGAHILLEAQRDGDEPGVTLRPSRHAKPVVFRSESGHTLFDTSSIGADEQAAMVIGGERDFYVWSCSMTYDPRLFVDFQADACLVVHDHEKFARRVNAAVEQVRPDLPGMLGSQVRYYDPLCPDDHYEELFTTRQAIAFFKDMRYAYQDEYRFVWPTRDAMGLPPLDVVAGPLSDICDLLEVPLVGRRP
ncbi:MAG: hypothetical protein ACYC6F_18980 [Longimicrobiales bacterium]